MGFPEDVRLVLLHIMPESTAHREAHRAPGEARNRGTARCMQRGTDLHRPGVERHERAGEEPDSDELPHCLHG